MNSIFKPALVLMVGRSLGFAVAFCVPLVVVRIFDQAEFGTYKQLFLIYGTLFGIAQFGMAESLYYFLPNASWEGGRYVMNALLALAVGGLLGLGVLAGAGSMISSWMGNGQLAPLLPFLVVFLLLTLPTAALEIVMITRQRYPWASWSYALSDFARAVFCLIPVLVLPRLESLLLGVIIFALLRLSASWWYLAREFHGDLRPDWELLKQQLTYAMPFQLAVLVETLQANFHQYAVSYYFDAATFAVYAVGCLQVPFVDFLFTPAGNVMMVRMSEELRDGRSNALLAIWHDTTRKLALVFFPMVALLLVAASDLIVFLFTENYRASVPIFMIWSTIILFATFQTDGVLRVYAETRFILLLNAVRLTFIVASIHWFLSAFHLAGAVIVTVIATFLGKALALVRMKSLLQISLSQLLPWRDLTGILIAAAAAGVLTLIVESALDIAKLPLLFITSLVYTVSYLTLLFRFNLLLEDEKLAFTRWLQRFTAGAAKAGELIRS